ncbi:unnamed protein product [Cylicocyclus nassatus]|uniref:Uncharacterized protein n=1 Tax=Cylicocyclus nassatus TaxID=53992 RepID=A0AA36DUT6_CYLNA|nr:unnamed protein product [Cylicocyclus nassatus]
MRPINSLLGLRIVLIALGLVFIRKCYEEYVRELHTNMDSLSSSSALQWENVDLENPPLTGNPLVERLRINELLAAVQYRCKEAAEISGEIETFTICSESGLVNNVFLVTGNKISSGMFEKKLGASRWTVFLPEGSELVENLEGDVEVHYLTELSDWDHWVTWDMEYAVRGRTFDLAKMDLYAPHMRSFDQPNVVRQLLQNMTAAQHLALVIDVGSESSSKTAHVIGRWYQLLYWLFFSKGYALVGASSTGLCGFETQSCKYYVSLLQMQNSQDQFRTTAPTLGLGSPEEELHRLLRYVQTSNCSVVLHPNFPAYCPESLKENARVLLISYQALLDVPMNLAKSPNFHIVTPMDVHNGINIHNYGIGHDGKNLSIDEQWKLKTLEETVDELYGDSTIDLLVIDMNGGEFSLFPELIQLANVSRFTRLSLRGHIWSEENENFRHLYWSMRQIETSGYSHKYGSVSLPRYDIVYERSH